jgi:hypothetical protein
VIAVRSLPGERFMAREQSYAKIVLSTKEVTVGGSVDVPGLKDNCTCSQGRFETSAMENGSLRKIMSSFDPSEIRSIADFVQLRDSLIAPNA